MEYLYPNSAKETIQLLESDPGRARIIAGGTDVLPDIRKGNISPAILIDITRIPGLDQIEVTDDRVQMGAAVTFAMIRESEKLDLRMQALVDAAASVGARAIQSAATWVGNIVQAMPAADGAIVALALEAEVLIVDATRSRWQSVESLFRGPGISAIDPTRQLLTHIRFALPQGVWGTAWGRVGRRPSLVLPVLNCAAKIVLNCTGQKIESATIGIGPVAPTPFRARQAEAFLVGKPAQLDVLEKAACLVQQASKPRDSAARASRDYRLALIPTTMKKSLQTAVQRAQLAVEIKP